MLYNAVARAVNRRRVQPVAEYRRLFSAVLDCFDTGVALLGEAGEVVHANDEMRALAALGVLRLSPEGLTFLDRAANEAYEALLAGIVSSGAEGASFAARDPAGNDALVVRVIAVADRRHARPGGCGAIVLAANPNRRPRGDRAFFGRALGLSRAEAGVAVTLLEGLDAKEVAARLHVSHETVRTHLKRIYEKTRTRRQAELVLLLAQIAHIGPVVRTLTHAGDAPSHSPS